ncbi:MAG TPA: enolase C-terminal domain-like protein [Bryobacteraceae bacterium]|nr:enolase C-terminal domain-like protein [Bryobacteraceae bacterium]
MRVSRRSLLAAAAASPLWAEQNLKITSVRAWPVDLAVTLAGTFQHAAPKFSSDFDPRRSRWFGPFSQLIGAIIVEIRTDRGITGYGMGGGGGAGKYIIEHHLADLLVSSNPLRVELLWDQMYHSMLFYGRKGVPIMALSGVDLALWDICGKAAGRPVHQLLGGPTKPKIQGYYTGFDMAGAVKLGFRAFKLPIRNGLNEGREGMNRTVSQLREVRQIIGPDALLMIDCLCQWDVPYTLEMADRLREFRLYWIEEPLSPDDLEGYARLCREVHGPLIASGEHEYTRFGFAELLRHKAVGLLQPDTTWSGGLTEVRRIAMLAAPESLPVVPHRGASPYGLAVIFSTPNCLMAESFGTLESANELLAAMTAKFENGFYYPHEKPGFGVEPTEALIQKFARQD